MPTRQASSIWTLQAASCARRPATRLETTQFTRFINTPSFSSQYAALYLATGLKEVDRSAIGPETPRPAVRLYTQQEAMEMVTNGTIVDAKTIIAILRLHEGLLEHIGM